MRTGKTKIVIDAAQFLFEAGAVDKVIVIAPAPVRDVWQDKELGEIAKHSWLDVPATITEFHAKTRTWLHAMNAGSTVRRLEWYVTNYEFIRAKTRILQLLPACGSKTLLVLDESSFVKSWGALQTKACLQLRRECGRVVLLNGTPIFHSPMDLFSQGNLLSPSILACKYVTHYKARYAVMEPVLGYGGKAITTPHGVAVTKVAGWTNLDDLQRRFAPHTVRRLQKECLDLPAKLDPVMLTAALEPSTWRAYRDIRDQMVVWLQSGDVVSPATAAVKVMRLSQITGGFLGGVEAANVGNVDLDDAIDLPGSFLDGVRLTQDGKDAIREQSEHFAQVASSLTVEIGREKLDVLLWFLGQRLEEDENLKVVAWCRFRAELFRMLAAVGDRFPQFAIGAIHGGQKKDERLDALRLLKPETAPEGPVFVAGIEGTGSFGLDFTASHTCVTVSSGYSPGKSAQTLDRVYGPGQRHPIAYYSIVATGPAGQKTIDHQIEVARRAGQDVAEWTAAHWVKALKEE